MAGLKLAKLPDRNPVKLVVHLPPALHAELTDYAALYRETYGEAEALTDLIPAMLAGYLAGDRAFARRRAGTRS